MRIYAKSPAAYKALQEVLILPSSTLIRKTKNSAGDVKPGIQLDVLNDLKIKLQNASGSSLSGVLIMDEMSIKGLIFIVIRAFYNIMFTKKNSF